MSERSEITYEDLPGHLQQWLGTSRVEEVECMISDFAGIARGKAMPWPKFSRQERMFMPTSIFYQTISGDYVDMDDLDLQWTENDMVLVPDLSTATAAPWADDVTVQVIHDVVNLKGEPISLVPRNVLKNVLALYEEKGWKPIIAPEMEFYLTNPNTNPNEDIEPLIGRTGRRMATRQAYSMAAVDEYSNVLNFFLYLLLPYVANWLELFL